jgi:hypothetical protein
MTYFKIEYDIQSTVAHIISSNTVKSEVRRLTIQNHKRLMHFNKL